MHRFSLTIGVLLVSTLVGLVGCSRSNVDGTKYLGQKGSAAFYDTASQATIAAYEAEVQQLYQDKCFYEGFAIGTSAMAACIRVKIAERAEEKRRNTNKMIQAIQRQTATVSPPAGPSEPDDCYVGSCSPRQPKPGFGVIKSSPY